jgi:hypothetical protein
MVNALVINGSAGDAGTADAGDVPAYVDRFSVRVGNAEPLCLIYNDRWSIRMNGKPAWYGTRRTMNG